MRKGKGPRSENKKKKNSKGGKALWRGQDGDWSARSENGEC
jgi:hypothetical protein